jgi:hypothetical protein
VNHWSRPGLRAFGRVDHEPVTDVVFAIAITLLVLEIGVPAGSEKDLLHALVEEWPAYLGYVVSFATIGAVWFSHTVITEYLDHADSVLIRLNLLLLLVVSFLPFPTRLLAEYTRSGKPSGWLPPSTESTCRRWCWCRCGVTRSMSACTPDTDQDVTIPPAAHTDVGRYGTDRGRTVSSLVAVFGYRHSLCSSSYRSARPPAGEERLNSSSTWA